ncbi:Crp/Fnr family transcriptional regulator [Tropicimonas marinistellae]|uniref:Crp/Fnr family transcriptional regulator n=1 Tax=Tropicimonas marinistellae TaxID=1739787 RepID=UPI000836337B|nr:Crp/Fnr family transcriptional regulator [Tropicimonas marinistellae]
MHSPPDGADALLSRADWLSVLPADLAQRVRDAAVRHKCPSGTVFWTYGDKPDGLYGLISGSVRMDTIWSRHGPSMLSTFHAGAWLGEAEFLADSPRITSMSALRSCEYLFIGAKTIETLARERPELWRGIGLLAFEHLSLAVAALDDAMIRSSKARLAAVLVRLCGARLGTAEDSVSSEIDVTQSDLAQMANLSRSVVGSHLEEFERNGIIRRSYGRMSVTDIDALRAAAGVDKSPKKDGA